MAPSKRVPSGKRNDSTKAFKSSKKSFKKTKDDVAARSEAMALQLEEVPDFPRGIVSFSPLSLERDSIESVLQFVLVKSHFVELIGQVEALL